MWLNGEIAAADADPNVAGVVVLTHWCPMLDSRVYGPVLAVGTGCFGSDLSDQRCMNSPKLMAWAWGQTDRNLNGMITKEIPAWWKLHIISNQRGTFARPIENFDEQLVMTATAEAADNVGSDEAMPLLNGIVPDETVPMPDAAVPMPDDVGSDEAMPLANGMLLN